MIERAHYKYFINFLAIGGLNIEQTNSAVSYLIFEYFKINERTEDLLSEAALKLTSTFRIALTPSLFFTSFSEFYSIFTILQLPINCENKMKNYTMGRASSGTIHKSMKL